ncbi:MAG: hypothetical protein CMJ28_02980, partial [Phycisphaerae bacterium]|nr:hypothetical protein [Phycisphaerae bacterium]
RLLKAPQLAGPFLFHPFLSNQQEFIMTITMLSKVRFAAVVASAHPCLRRGRGASPSGGAA